MVVYRRNGEIYSAVLALTNISKNFNKFYKLQILSNPNGFYIMYTTWGRIGKEGQQSIRNFSNLDDSIFEFEEKFFKKTAIKWRDRLKDIPSKFRNTYHYIQLEEEELIAPMFNILGNKCYEECLPLGTLTRKQLTKGIDILNRMLHHLRNKTFLKNQSNEFYSTVPHNFKRKYPKFLTNFENIFSKRGDLKNMLSRSVELMILKRADVG